ncbi:hypothetical protein CQW23_22733 [Capsicum baccatum]|uniref:Jacalin-type lectin domain-containing protein n=3 Tax=Capsicum TaxID=4071 RepID=A0A1U8G3T4_CAPAN|nr:putative cyanate hydratase-like [Capsicum annuum]KAF3677473.1 putative cyanate hydratase-like [Capsicum annuum]PHT39160.1 hypothetical protein CQW23_22733 [Capsicum baccatum]PHT85581.1 hypothetical protein T459_07687 [Capsicum annuum]
MAEAATSKAISEITKQAIFLYGVDEQVRALVTELGRMRSFLKDVDSRKQTEERVKNWADEIRDLAQDAEGIVEKYAAEVKQIKGEDTAYCFWTILINVVKEVVVRYKIGWDIGKINKRIKNLTQSLRTYGIIHGINEGETSFREVILQSGSIYVERWGGLGGGLWSYRPKGLVKHIIVKHGGVIDSIMFKSIEENGVMEASQRFGGVNGHLTTEININSPSEYLTGISGTFGQYLSSTLIKSIMFHTNISHHGPIVGSEKETADEKFSFIMQGGVVVGFHGFSGLFLDSIGLYVMPCNSLLS